MGAARRGARVVVAHHALVLLPVLLAFGRVVANGFVSLDDGEYITRNPMVRGGLSWRGVAWAFTTFHAANWHPVTWLSHQLDASIFGVAPAGHHAVGLLLHAVNALLLQRVVWAYTGRRWRGTVVALLFAVHPLRVESVAWAAERKDLLAGLFWMLALLAYRRRAAAPGRGRLALPVALFAVGLLAKPTLVALPLVLLALDGWPLGRAAGAGGGGTAVAALAAEKAPFVLLAGASAAVTLIAQAAGETVSFYPLGHRLANAAVSAVSYVGETAWPTGLAVYYPFRTAVPPGEAIAAALAVAAAIAGAVSARRRAPWLATGLLWYLAALLPVAGIVQVGDQAMADRYTYIPGVGLGLAGVWSFAEALRRRPGSPAKLAGAAVVAAGALCAATFRQGGFWRDSETLFTRALSVTEGNWLAHDHLGVLSAAAGRPEEAKRHYEASILHNPSWYGSRNNLGNILLREGRPAEAVDQHRMALLLRPGDPVLLYNLGIGLSRLGRDQEAIGAYRDALARDPGNARIHLNLALVLQKAGDVDGARDSFQRALALDPGSDAARLGLGRLDR